MRSPFLILITVLFATLAPALPAQTEALNLEFSAISFDSMPQELWYESEGKLMELQAGGSVRGPLLRYSGENPVNFFRLVPDGQGGKKRVMQASATIPQGVSQALLCFLPNTSPNAALPWKIFVMDDSSQSFAPGDIRFINFAGKAVAGVLGEEKIRLLPNTERTITPDLSDTEGFGIKLAAYLDEQWEPFFSARWPHRKNVRLMILFLPDTKSGKVKMRAVPQNWTR